MMKIFQDLLGAIVISSAVFHVFSRLCKKKMNWKDKKTYILLFSYVVVLIFTYLETNQFFKNMINLISLVVLMRSLFNKNMNKTVILSALTLGIIGISEMLCAILLVFVLQVNQAALYEYYFTSLLTNVIIAAIAWLIVKSDKVTNFFNRKVENIDEQNEWVVILFAGMTIFSLTIVIYYIYFQVNLVHSLILSISLVLILLFLVFNVINEKGQCEQLQVKYDIMNHNLNDYAKMLNVQLMQNHENDNNLAALRGMIHTDKEAIDFIDSLTENRPEDNQSLMLKTQNIPTGGLRGLIYQKLLLMEEKNIRYNIEVSKKIKKTCLKHLNITDYKNICTITGVYLDNAIQEVQKYEQKLIGIYMYKEKGEIVIKISNNYCGTIDIENMDKVGYSTKGEMHGCGLGVVAEILQSTDQLTSYKTFDGNIFSQLLKIK